MLPATEADLAALAAPVPMPAWPGLAKVTPVHVAPLPAGLSPADAAPSDDPATRRLLERVADLLALANVLEIVLVSSYLK